VILAVLLFIGGVLIGYVIEGERQYRTWGPMCNGAAMSQAALNEHLRIRHGDS
jgi:hypothetical protein